MEETKITMQALKDLGCKAERQYGSQTNFVYKTEQTKIRFVYKKGHRHIILKLGMIKTPKIPTLERFKSFMWGLTGEERFL